MEAISVFAPASVANVSCGFDILGFCLDGVGDEFYIEKTVEPGVHFKEIIGQKLPLDPQKNVAGVAALALLKQHPSDCGFAITLTKGIKPGSGIGSSSASAVGVVYALNELMGLGLSKMELLPFALEGEMLASQAAHADNIAPALLGGFTLVRSLQPMDIVSIPTPSDLYAAVIHPLVELKTAEARSVLSTEVSFKDSIQQSANLGALISGLHTADYDLISRSLVDILVEPKRAPLIPNYSALKQAALNANALGAGISGAGPSVFALCKGKENAKAVAQSMREVLESSGTIFETFVSPINTQGTTTTKSHEIL
jgi:homoserine kinase